jgi:hypothetical protein
MNAKIRSGSMTARRLLQKVISVSLLIGGLSAVARGQAPAAETGEIYAGIELSAAGIKAVALRVYRGEDEPGLKLVYSEIFPQDLKRSETGALTEQAVTGVAQAVLKLISRLRQRYQVPPERIHLVGSSELAAPRPENLISVISKTTGKTLTFLDAETEVQLGLVGTIPRREKVGASWIDNRDSSVLIDIGNESMKGGYQLLKYTASAPPRYDFVTMKIPQGTLSLSEEISRSMGEEDDWTVLVQRANSSGSGPIREALRKEWEGKPGLSNRKRVYLTGDIAWALVTLLYPEDRQPFVRITAKDITTFANRAARSPHSLLKPNLSNIKDQELRQEIGKDLTAIRKAFRPQELVVGAELLKAFAGELNWQEKNVWFARFGHFGCILSYVRLQAGK